VCVLDGVWYTTTCQRFSFICNI